MIDALECITSPSLGGEKVGSISLIFGFRSESRERMVRNSSIIDMEDPEATLYTWFNAD